MTAASGPRRELSQKTLVGLVWFGGCLRWLFDGLFGGLLYKNTPCSSIALLDNVGLSSFDGSEGSFLQLLKAPLNDEQAAAALAKAKEGYTAGSFQTGRHLRPLKGGPDGRLQIATDISEAKLLVLLGQTIPRKTQTDALRWTGFRLFSEQAAPGQETKAKRDLRLASNAARAANRRSILVKLLLFFTRG